MARQNVSSDDDIVFVPTQKSKAKSMAKASARKKDVPEYYPESEDPVSEDEVARPAPRRTRGRLAAAAEDDAEDFGDAMAAIPDADDSVGDSTLKSSAQPAEKVSRRRAGTTKVSTRRSASTVPPTERSPTAKGTGARKRGRVGSDSDDGVSFKGFAGGKKRLRR